MTASAAPFACDEARKGRLKIFLGAAPGVGKTYAMLEAARARLRDGVDVVAGVVETHGRSETQAMLSGIEIIPRRRVDYRERVLDEMDLDALLRVDARSSPWSTSSRIRMPTAAATRSVPAMSPSCSRPASMSTRR